MLFVARSALKYGQRLSDFHDFLCRFPYLGSEHPLGVAMRRSISTFPVLTLRNQRWLRARRVGSGEIAGMSSENMWAPDPTIHPVHQGRYNHEGQAVLYLSEDLETAVAEVFDRPSGEKEGTVAIQEFNIVSLERVLDVTGASSRSLLYAALVYEGHLSRALENSSMWKPEYFVPRFVADLARFKGLNGILYRTSKTFCATGLNLVVFNPRREDFRADGHPKIYGRSAHRQSIGLGDAEIVSYVITPHSTA